MRRLFERYRQFQALPPDKVSRELIERRDEQRAREVVFVPELDLSRTAWHEPPHPEAVNAATFALRRRMNAYPDPGTRKRQRLDRLLAAFVLVVETLVCLTLWGPQPIAWLWVGSQVDYHTDSVSFGILVAFVGMIATLMLTLALAVRLDGIWKVIRRAGGIDQRDGVLSRIFMVTAVVAALAFGFWFLIIEGPGPTLAPK